MKRGQIVSIVTQGDFGKPRPALIVQSDVFNQTHASVTVLPISSELTNAPLFRIDLIPDERNGLNKPCQIMVDKLVTVKRDKIGKIIGQLDDTLLLQINRAMFVWLGLA